MELSRMHFFILHTFCYAFKGHSSPLHDLLVTLSLEYNFAERIMLTAGKIPLDTKIFHVAKRSTSVVLVFF